MGRRKKYTKKLAQVERELKSLSDEMQRVIEEEERILARLDTGPNRTAWKGLRHSHKFQPNQSRRLRTEEEETKSFCGDAVDANDTEESSIKTTDTVCSSPSPKRRLKFDDFSGMDSDSKFERIRKDIHMQEEKIRFLMSRMNVNKTDHDQCTSQSI